MDTVTTESVIVGNLRIPAENFAEWERLNHEMHELTAAGKTVPCAMQIRTYVLQGASEADARLIASVPPGHEENDTREL